MGNHKRYYGNGNIVTQKNAKELVLDKINASIETLGMYVYAISMGIDIKQFTKFMMNPIVNKIIELSKSNLIEEDRSNSSIDNAIKYVKQGYIDPKNYGEKLGYNYKYQIIQSLQKLAGTSINYKDFGKTDIFQCIIDPRMAPKELNSFFETVKSKLLENKYNIYIDKKGGPKTYSEESDSGDDYDFDDSNEYDDEFGAKNNALNITKPLYKWFKDSDKLFRDTHGPGLNAQNVAMVFERVKKESEALKVLGRMLSINQSIKSSEFDFYKYQSELSNYINKRFSEKLEELSDEKNPMRDIFIQVINDYGFNFTKFMTDSDYRQNMIDLYQNMTENKELNLLEILSSSDHFMEMIKMTTDLDSHIYKNVFSKYRILSNIVNDCENYAIFGTQNGLKKNINEETYNKLSNYVDDLLINDFLSTNSIKINPINGDRILGISNNKSFEYFATNNSKSFDLSTTQGRTQYTNWFENIISNIQATNSIKKSDGQLVKLKELSDNVFLRNIKMDSKTDRITNQDYFFLKPAITYDSKMSDSDKMVITEMVKGLKGLKGIKYGNYDLQDLFFLYDLIVNRNKKSKTSFSYFTSEAFDIDDNKLLSNKYLNHIKLIDANKDYSIDYSMSDFIPRAIAVEAFGDIKKQTKKIIESVVKAISVSPEAARSFDPTKIVPLFYKRIFNFTSKKLENVYYKGNVQVSIDPFNISKNMPLNVVQNNINIDNNLIKKMFDSLNSNGNIIIKCK